MIATGPGGNLQTMATKATTTVSLGPGIGAAVETTLSTICADDFGKAPPPAVDWVPGELFVEVVGTPAESTAPGIRERLDQAIEVLKQPPPPLPPDAVVWSGLYYAVRPVPSPYLPIINTVSSMAPELARLARGIGMPEPMFRDGVTQYTIWRKVGEGTDRPFTRQSIRDLLVQTLQAAGREPSERRVEEASDAFWGAVETVTAKLGTVPAGPRPDVGGGAGLGEGSGTTVQVGPRQTTQVSIPLEWKPPPIEMVTDPFATRPDFRGGLITEMGMPPADATPPAETGESPPVSQEDVDREAAAAAARLAELKSKAAQYAAEAESAARRAAMLAEVATRLAEEANTPEADEDAVKFAADAERTAARAAEAAKRAVERARAAADAVAALEDYGA